MVRFLIIRFSSIGDIVLTTPVIRCLKKQVGEAEIHFLVKKQFLPVISANPYIDIIHCLDDNLNTLTSSLRNKHFDFIIDLHHNIRSFIVKSRIPVMSFSINKINPRKWLMVNFKINRLPDLHIVDRYFETVRSFDVSNDGNGLDYFIPPEDEIDIQNLPVKSVKGYIALVVGGKHATKQMPVEMIVALCKLLDTPVILLGGPEDIETCKIIAEMAGSHVYNTCGSLNINQSASLVKQSRLLITPDTGLMHIGAAFRKIIISVWGNTIPEFGMYPYMPDPSSKIFEVKGLSCRPCSRIGYDKCPKKHFRCMKDLNIREIAEMANKLVQ